MQIRCYCPRREKLWKDNGDGSFSAHVNTDHGLVEVFTYVGDERHRAFTSLHLYLAIARRSQEFVLSANPQTGIAQRSLSGSSRR